MSTARLPLRRCVRGLLLLVGLVALAAPSSACTRVTLISAYDEQIDQGATQLQKQLDAFLTHLERVAGTPEAEFSRNTTFYDDYGVELRALKVRASAVPQNSRTTQQLELMERSLDQLRQAHESGPIAREAIRPFRDLFAQAWGAIIALELAKKRGG